MPNFKTLHITQRATKDLQNIATYTQQTWGAKQKRKYLAQLHQGFQALCLNSDLGTLRGDPIQGMQSFLVEGHIIFYIVVADELQIIRVLHQSMDFEQHLS